jgi:hypothetical protein
MGNDNISFEDECLRGKYAREIRNYFEEKNIQNWWVSPSPKKAEILIHPLNGLPENERNISRISVQINNGGISFGISGYNYVIVQDTIKACESQGYKYHKKDINKYGRKEDGRWWLTKPINNFNELANEFKSIEYFLY